MITSLKRFLSPAKTEKQNELLLEFKKYYDEHHLYVRNIIYWMVRADDIDDIIQESFLKAWNKYPAFKKGSSFKTWIHRIAINTAIDQIRKNHRVLPAESSMEKAEDNETKDLISKVLLKLKFESREVLILAFKFEYTQQEMSELIGIPVGTVKSRLHQAKNEFKAICLEKGIDL